jgi:pyridoxine 5-phosphate synthase
MLKLGVNIDHVATVREARKTVFPSPVNAALLSEEAGAWGITAHLREDRRHINDDDITLLKSKVKRLNMEMAVTHEMVEIAKKVKPRSSCLVPEKREELTTEGGLNLLSNYDEVADAVRNLMNNGIIVSIFIDPDSEQIKKASETGAEYIELHTGSYANALNSTEKQHELDRLIKASEYANTLKLKVNAGHGIDYTNITGILQIPYLHELNIGHSIVARSIVTGIKTAVAEMIELMKVYV